ncbi:MAG: hypothetical protein MK186_14340 [Henriciella sp.]|nr:hypothetical protein [Henriciella sp.]
MQKQISVTNLAGVAFNVRIVEQGDRYGINRCLIHDKAEPLVEFYDSRFDIDRDEHGSSTGLGQFVSRYNISLLYCATQGVVLDGGVPDWYIETEPMEEVCSFLAPFNPRQYEKDHAFPF